MFEAPFSETLQKQKHYHLCNLQIGVNGLEALPKVWAETSTLYLRTLLRSKSLKHA